MGKVTKQLISLIERLEADLDAQIKRAYEAEQGLDILKEDLKYERETRGRQIDMAVERNERDRTRLIEERNRVAAENANLRVRLQKYEGARIKEAATWLRETDLDDITTHVNQAMREQYGEDTHPVNPLVDKIPMIKYVRNTWDLGLKDSKDIVDAWYAEMKATFDAMIMAATNPITESEQRVLDGNR